MTESARNIFENVFAAARKYGVALGIVALAGIAANPLENPAWREAKKTMPEISTETLTNTAGTGLALGTVGGFRTVLADIAWLRAFHFWGKNSLSDCENLTALARTLDPQNYFFWENSVNYAAYDFPNWVIESRGGSARVSEPVQREIHRKSYENAMSLIGRMAENFPERGSVWTFAAQMSLIKTERIYGKPDFALALKFYMQAMECKVAPWFCFFAYGNVVKTHFPEKIPEARAYFEARLATAKTQLSQRVIGDALKNLDEI